MAGTTHYSFEVKDPQSVVWKVEIKDTTYVGTDTIDLSSTTGGNGFNLKWQGASEELYTPIIASDISLELDLSTNSKNLLNAIIAGPECRFIIIVYKSTIRFWQGFVMQDEMSKPDAGDNTEFISLKGTDGFGLLKDIKYSGYDIDALTRFTFTHWLSIVGASLPLQYVTGSIFAQASVWYEDSQRSSVVPTPTDGDPLYNQYFNESAFLEVDNYGEVKPQSLYDILYEILKVNELQISQCNGVYLLIQQNTYVQVTTRFWFYDKTGAYVTTTTEALQQTMQQRASGGTYNYILPAKEVRTEYEYRHGIYRNNLFPAIVERGTTYSLGLSTQGAALAFSGWIETKFTGSGGTLALIKAAYKCTIRNGSHYLKEDTGGELVWTTNASDYVPVRTLSFKSDYPTEQTRLTHFAFESPLPEEGQPISFLWDFWEYEYFTSSLPWSDVGNTNSATHESVEGSFVGSVNTGIPMEGTQLFKATVSNSARADIDMENSTLGDGANKYSAGAIFVNDTVPAIVPSNFWTIYSEIGGTAYAINSLRVREMLALRRATVEVYNGTFVGSPDFHKGFLWDSKYWMFTSIDFDCNDGSYSFTAFAVVLDRTGITVAAPLTKQDSQGSSASTGSNGSTTQGTTPTPNYWKRTGPLLEPDTAGDNIKTTSNILGSNISAIDNSDSSNQTSIQPGGIVAQSKLGISDWITFIKSTEPTTGTELYRRTVDYFKTPTAYTEFKEYIKTVGTWGATSRGIQWVIQTVITGATILSDRIKILATGSFQIGNDTNNTTFDLDGKQKMNGSATVWKDVLTGGLSVKLHGSNDPTLSQMSGGKLRMYTFSATAMNEVFFNVQFPHEYKEGSDIEPHVHWIPFNYSPSASNVIWKLEYQWVNYTDVFSAVATTTLTATAATGTVGDKHLINSFGVITGTGKTISSILVCRLYRDGANVADTATGLAGLLSFDFHVECDSLGSDTEYGK